MSEGSIYRRKSDGRWTAEWIDNQGRRTFLYRRTKDQARAALRAQLKLRDEGASGDDPTLQAWTGWWLDQLDLRPTTTADYRYKIGLLPDWLMSKRLTAVSPMDVHEALRQIGNTPTVKGPRSPSTVAAVRTVLVSSLKTAQQWGHVTRNVAALTSPPKMSTPEIVPLDVEEAQQLLTTFEGHRLESLFTVALALGLRQSECVGLRWTDIDLKTGTLTVGRQLTRTNTGTSVDGDPKTRRSKRIVQLPKRCVTQLTKHKTAQAKERLANPVWEDHGLVWPSGFGTPLGHRNLLRLLHRHCEIAGVRRVSFHTLRHSAATLLLTQGVSERVILDVLGQSDLRMIVRYQHVNDSLRQSAADAVDRAFGDGSPVNFPVKRLR